MNVIVQFLHTSDVIIVILNAELAIYNYYQLKTIDGVSVLYCGASGAVSVDGCVQAIGGLVHRKGGREGCQGWGQIRGH